MTILVPTKKQLEISSIYSCIYCGKKFKRAATLESHLCETKRRIDEKDFPGNRIAFQCWLEFINTTSARAKTAYIDFAKSPYYLAFRKFGQYCVDVKCVNVIEYLRWLLDNKIKIDTWTLDSIYDRFLKQYLRLENPFSAVERSIEATIALAELYDVRASDVLRYCNKNRICSYIINGKISPWILYQSESGIQFLESLDAGQSLMILDYIDPELWALRFTRATETSEIKRLLKAGGY